MLLNQRLTTLVDAMPAAQAGDMRSVHQARVATRRLREALPVLRVSVDGDEITRVRRQVRRMTRALGPVRELDVALAPGAHKALRRRGGVRTAPLGNGVLHLGPARLILHRSEDMLI